MVVNEAGHDLKDWTGGNDRIITIFVNTTNSFNFIYIVYKHCRLNRANRA